MRNVGREFDMLGVDALGNSLAVPQMVKHRTPVFMNVPWGWGREWSGSEQNS